MNNKIKLKIEELRKKIHQWNDEYFNKNNPSVQDSVYDAALLELKKLEKKHFHLFTLEENNSSPTKIIGAKNDSRFKKVKHQFPMLSLNKAYSFLELEKFAKNVLEINSKSKFYVEPKIDGLSISLLYENGELIQALTRGDGIEGEDVTHNILVISDSIIPKKITYKEKIEIRGEIFLDKNTFKELNQKLKNENKTLFANPRNAAAGTLRQLNSNIAKERNLKAFLYQIIMPEIHNINTVSEAISFLKKHNFSINKLGKSVNNIKEAYDEILLLEKEQNNLNYEIDGVVVKVEDFSIYENLGQTSKFPHSAIAFKYDDEIVETKLIDIFPTVGRTGIITYNAILEPVRLNGSIVSAATLHNYNYIDELKIVIGKKVFVKKAGEIIPKVLGSVEKHEKTNYLKIQNCPECNSLLKESDTGIDQFCINESCPEIQIKKIIHFVSKNALNIEGLGEKIVRLFFEKKLISDVSSIFDLNQKINLLQSLEGFQEKSILNLLNAIEKAKNIEFSKLIFGLGIKHVGEKMAGFLAQEIGDLNNLIIFNYDSLIHNKDIGNKTIESLKEFFSNKTNIEILEKLQKVNFNLIINKAKEGILNNLSFVITGTLSRSRKEIQNILESYGAKINSSISSKTNYLIAGLNSGSKLVKAQELGVKVINEPELFEWIAKLKKEK